jgi:hypothetical protein
MAQIVKPWSDLPELATTPADDDEVLIFDQSEATEADQIKRNRKDVLVHINSSDDLENGVVTPEKSSFLADFSNTQSLLKLHFGKFYSLGTLKDANYYIDDGWSVSKTATGVYRITHNIGASRYGVVITPEDGVSAGVDALSDNYFDVKCYAVNDSSPIDSIINFMLFEF